eukprot:363062-Chlamydomonas_euryale.AAC.18
MDNEVSKKGAKIVCKSTDIRTFARSNVTNACTSHILTSRKLDCISGLHADIPVSSVVVLPPGFPRA